MRGLRGWGVAAMVATIVGLVPVKGHAVEHKQVTCDGFVLGYTGKAAKKQCEQADVSTGTASEKASQLQVDGDGFVMSVAYYQSGFRTYFQIVPLEKLAAEAATFYRLDGWQGSRKVAGFDLEAFSGTMGPSEVSIYCAVFSKYGGEVGKSGEVARLELGGGPGYKNFLVGFYCSRFKAVASELPPPDFYLDVEAALLAIRQPL